MEETWKNLPINLYLSKYQASNLGNIRNKISGYIHTLTKKGNYRSVHLVSDTGKNHVYTVHRLICGAFHMNPENLPTVDHIIGFDNNSSNLRWASYHLQCKNRTYNKDKTHKGSRVFQYNRLGDFIQMYESAQDAARNTGLLNSNIVTVCSGRLAATGGFIWKYYEDTDEFLDDYPSSGWKVYPMLETLQSMGCKWRELQVHLNGGLLVTNSWNRKRLMTGTLDGSRYKRLHINTSVSLGVHELVTMTFLKEKPSQYHVVNHKNHNRVDNNLSNLEWVTRSENNIHSFHSDLSIRGKKMPVVLIDGTEKPLIKFRSVVDVSSHLKVSTTEIFHLLKTPPHIIGGSILKSLTLDEFVRLSCDCFIASDKS